MGETDKLGKDLAEYFRQERYASVAKGVSYIPPALFSDKIEEREEGAARYAESLLSKPATELATGESAWLAGEIGRFLKEGE